MNAHQYQIGGSLKSDDPNYVERSADRELYQALKSGQFCYVLNARQMGKSSLLVRAKTRLQNEGFSCATIDMTQIGSENITPSQWYKGIVVDLWRSFQLIHQFHLKTWWNEEEEFSPLQRLKHFLETVLLENFPQQNIVIFIDEIDSILSLDFSVSDFFALIRFCYNQRAINPEYNRLNFAIFGVATPSDLIRDKTRTPFNIGAAIELQGFKQNEATPLARNFRIDQKTASIILQEILFWTCGQPFLTQKLCFLVQEFLKNQENQDLSLNPEKVPSEIQDIVRENIIQRWEYQDEPEHLRTIRDRLLYKEEIKGRLLGIYQQILKQKYTGSDHFLEKELILSGLVIKDQGSLKVKNPIYATVFNLEWVENQLSLLRPYSQSFEGWLVSEQQDQSRFLRGKTLVEAQDWARGKSLSDLDYQFLAASEQFDREEMRQLLEAERIKEVEARLIQEQKFAKSQQILLGILTLGFCIATGLGITAFMQYRQASINELKAIAQSSTALFASEKRLEALVQALKATQKARQFPDLDPNLQEEIHLALQKAVYGAIESNRLSNFQGGVNAVTFSPNGQFMATASLDGMIKLWTTQGQELKTLIEYPDRAWRVVFSPDSSLLAASNAQGIINIWRLNDGHPEMIQTIKAHAWGSWRITFSPEGQFLASAGFDQQAKIWKLDGTLVATLPHQSLIRGLAFSPDGQTLVTGGADKLLKIWQLDGTFIKTLKGHQSLIHSVVFSPDGQQIISGDEDGTILLWGADGRLIKSLKGHDTTCFDLAFAPDGQTFTSVSQDNTVKVWRKDGTLLLTLNGHQGEIRGVAFSPDGKTIASASVDGSVRMWQLQGMTFVRTLRQGSSVTGLDISPNGELFATGFRDGIIQLWETQGNLLQIVAEHHAQVRGISFSPDQQMMASTSLDRTLKIWDVSQKQLKLIKTVIAHQGAAHVVHFSPDGKTLATTGLDGKIQLWTPQGKLIRSIQACSLTLGLSFSPDGQEMAVACSDRNRVLVWNLQGELLHTLTGHTAAPWTAVFSPDGRWIASVSADNTAKIWRRDGTLVTTLIGHKSVIWNALFSRDSQMLITTATDHTIKLWSVPDGRLINTLNGHNNSVENLAITPDGQFLVSGSADTNIIIIQ